MENRMERQRNRRRSVNKVIFHLCNWDIAGKPSSTSSQHLPSHGSPWSEEEQRLFEEGLVKEYSKKISDDSEYLWTWKLEVYFFTCKNKKCTTS